jgi:hypothetical protein
MEPVLWHVPVPPSLVRIIEFLIGGPLRFEDNQKEAPPARAESRQFPAIISEQN